MIGLTKLVTGRTSPSDRYRYGQQTNPDDNATSTANPSSTIRHSFFGAEDGYHPVVVWNITESCNLECEHCYYSAILGRDVETLDKDTILKVIDELAQAKVPVLLLSGGEPLLRRDLLDIAKYCADKGINPVLSTNGTLIKSQEQAIELKNHGIHYVGISIDGLKTHHDQQRRRKGSFDKTVKAIQYCVSAGQRVSIRFTATSSNLKDLPGVLDLASELNVDRFCLYHLVPSGRGKHAGDITNRQRRELIWALCDQAQDRTFEILTVDAPADGPLIHQWALANAPDLAPEILRKLKSQGADGTGKRIVEIDHKGDVHPNQFWLGTTLGNVVDNDFNEIFNPSDPSELDPLLASLRDEPWFLQGQCSSCTYQTICGGFRVRALNMQGDLWASDPACTLTQTEREGMLLV